MEARRKPMTRTAGILICGLFIALASPARAQNTAPFTLRGKVLTLYLYGPAKGAPVIVASGDGGWVHLGPHVADVLARAGYFVVGVDSKQYLSVFTVGKKTLRPEDVPRDFQALIAYAAGSARVKPVLVGVSEGAGLSVLAATDPSVRALVGGVIALGLPNLNELGWRWQDSVIYFTKGVPDEPTFSVTGLIDRVAPLPLAAIHATGDEFVPVAELQRMMARAGEPKRVWIITASNHRFSDNEREFDRRLAEALEWVRANAAR
jgi:dienelactone hydrolase